MNDFKMREDGIGHITMSNPDIGYKMPPLEQIIMQEYPYIYESFMENHPFYLENANVGLFKEIVHENKVVGFSGYDSGMGVMALKYIYVLPEFRGNNLLIKDLWDTKNLFEKHGYPYVAIDTPNWYVINSLINHGYATRFNNHIIITDIPLTFQIKKGDKVSDDEIKFLEKMGMDTGEEIKSLQANTNIYDENICACVSLDLKMITAMCDEDMKHRPDLLFDRMIDPTEYFSNLEEEIKGLIDEGVLSYASE